MTQRQHSQFTKIIRSHTLAECVACARVGERASAYTHTRTHTVLTRFAFGLPRNKSTCTRIFISAHSASLPFLHPLPVPIYVALVSSLRMKEIESERKCCLFLLSLVCIALHCIVHRAFNLHSHYQNEKYGNVNNNELHGLIESLNEQLKFISMLITKIAFTVIANVCSTYTDLACYLSQN